MYYITLLVLAVIAGAKRMPQIVNAKLGPADVFARCIERPPD